ncbi:hypothetical protein CBM2586_P90003 [Cupriavidus phytorum]|uniref:Uncharacterized protein n=2 Tax=Cupriavidus TaxID=106589 RepID=A0A375F7E2_9BURK|nr:hypothetical protein CBM2588_P100033 [Cupriavidus taiwanensis]SOZ40845.1 hypothetical protein CBM2605_P90031 [Cupriavidus neocaledonicus]SOY77146.1 hypothetical protein CBM2585_P90031 [Cupriavidus taiwanensis]SOY77408.1 hypothetical protein CBM2589_P90031 [Cupriavidus taiwanensis]SOY78252.1 hypothetical protein CBM2586_P90003 [Cupriavidus taiwanensis]
MDALFEHDAGRGALHFRIPVQAEATDNACRSLPVRGGGTAVAVVVRAEGCPELVDIGDIAFFQRLADIQSGAVELGLVVDIESRPHRGELATRAADNVPSQREAELLKFVVLAVLGTHADCKERLACACAGQRLALKLRGILVSLAGRTLGRNEFLNDLVVHVGLSRNMGDRPVGMVSRGNESVNQGGRNRLSGQFHPALGGLAAHVGGGFQTDSGAAAIGRGFDFVFACTFEVMVDDDHGDVGVTPNVLHQAAVQMHNDRRLRKGVGHGVAPQ